MTNTLIDIATLQAERDEARAQVEQLVADKAALLEHIDDLYLRIDDLQKQATRARVVSIDQAYRLGGMQR